MIYYIFSKQKLSCILIAAAFLILCLKSQAAERLPLYVKQNIPGAPQLLGVPFAAGKLYSPDHVRLLNKHGVEIPSQITLVNTWEPVNNSIKWIWVFFFSEKDDVYTLEYGNDVKRKPYTGQRVLVENRTRPSGATDVTTGPLKFTIDRRGGGFLDKVYLVQGTASYSEKDVIATSDKERGTFLDILDKAGLDPSKATVTATIMELGSGPLHAILRVEGFYKYNRSDNNSSPFVMRIHAYAGKSYIRVLHTITYTGDPDNHTKVEGEYPALATQNKKLIDQEKLKNDPGWTQPNDRIAAAGFSINYNLTGKRVVKTGYFDGNWSNPGKEILFKEPVSENDDISLLQTGLNPSRIPPLETSSNVELMSGGFTGSFAVGKEKKLRKERMAGWVTVNDDKWGIGVGIRNFFEEYPKEIALQGRNSTLFSYIWSPNVEPLSFQKADGDYDSGLIGNFAQGLSKTTEIVYQFFKSSASEKELQDNFKYFMDPPVSHVEPAVYANSKVFGNLSARDSRFEEYERALDYKFDWMSFNQKWEPWYGMLDYGDFKAYYINKKDWISWNSNEPAIDYMWWLEFVRTGNRDRYLTAWSSSLHTMDVDNINWPTFPQYVGDSNDAVDFFDHKDKEKTVGTPYLGMGRRHANQHFTSLLSAHVWVPGWLASYYIAGNHRGLDLAEQTGDYYIRRVFGDHGLRGRRLYLSIWNLAEIYDASKKTIYWDELNDRVKIVLELQKNSEQAGSLVIDRYGYAHVYIAQGLHKYYQMTSDKKVRDALVTHARWHREMPAMNHKIETVFASIQSLLLGYEFTSDKSFLDEAIKRAEFLKTDKLPKAPKDFKTQKEFYEALEGVAKMPLDDLDLGNKGPGGEAIWKISNGFRVFGWTTAYNIPYLVYWLQKENIKK
ncbi:MAG: exo-rhamnogalacturonan lyase family protein [Ginsengibacter sp.]